jgi:hypothetical protein
MQTGLIEILVMIALVPYVTVRAWLDRFNHLPPREAETARAAHGVAIALLFPLIMHWADRYGWVGQLRYMLPYDWLPYLRYRWFAVFAVIAFGAHWFIVGAARSQGYRDARYIIRSLVKIAAGAAITYAQNNFWMMDYPLRSETFGIISLIGFWMIITGGVRAALYMRGPPRPDLGDDIGPQPYGGAGYGTGFDD